MGQGSRRHYGVSRAVRFAAWDPRRRAAIVARAEDHRVAVHPDPQVHPDRVVRRAHRGPQRGRRAHRAYPVGMAAQVAARAAAEIPVEAHLGVEEL